MKRLIATMLFGLSLLFTPVAAALGDWQFNLSTPGTSTLTNKKDFNVQFTALSTDSSDKITVELFQNGVSKGSKTTAGGGGSDTFAVNAPIDGTYTFKGVASNNNGGANKEKTVAVTVDTTAPGKPVYGSKSRNGNTWTVTFTAPSDCGSGCKVYIYSSTSTSFTAGPSNQVGVINLIPGNQYSFNYTAGNSQERFHAVQAQDQAGNYSGLSGDPNVVATPVNAPATRGAGGGAVAATQAGAGTIQAAPAGQVGEQAATTGETGDVLGAEAKQGILSKDNAPAIIALILAAAALGYYYFLRRRRAQD